MSAVRVTAMLCITLLVIITGAMVHSSTQERYIILPQNNSMFIFDRKTAVVNYCTEDQCKLVMPYGSGDIRNINPGMLMSGIPVTGMLPPSGFQPFASPLAENNNMFVSTSMNNPMGNTNNPMMMWAYMQAAQSAANSVQKGGSSSLRSQPSWTNIMAMMQPTAATNAKAVTAQSPLMPVAMSSALANNKPKKASPAASQKETTLNQAPALASSQDAIETEEKSAAATEAQDVTSDAGAEEQVQTSSADEEVSQNTPIEGDTSLIEQGGMLTEEDSVQEESSDEN